MTAEQEHAPTGGNHWRMVTDGWVYRGTSRQTVPAFAEYDAGTFQRIAWTKGPWLLEKRSYEDHPGSARPRKGRDLGYDEFTDGASEWHLLAFLPSPSWVGTDLVDMDFHGARPSETFNSARRSLEPWKDSLPETIKTLEDALGLLPLDDVCKYD